MTFIAEDDERLMREALVLAAEADSPFGAVIARDGNILARGFNMGQRTHDPTAHGEMVAIRAFLAEHGADALKGTTLYTTGEPCVMCMGAIIWSGIARLVYAASIAEISAHMGQVMITATEIADKAPFAKIDITGGVLAREALKLFPPQ
jgi:tRNA(Arg) A34 adenosine deaminase TadA